MPTAQVEPLPSSADPSSHPASAAERTAPRRSPATSALIAVVGTRLWAEVRARRALEDAGLTTMGADDALMGGPNRRHPDLVLLVRTENSPVATAREAQLLAGVPAGVGLVVAGRVGFHPFDHRVTAEMPLERFASTDLSVVACEVRRLASQGRQRVRRRVNPRIRPSSVTPTRDLRP